MCILKIHAQSHTANAIQSAAHNMDTTVSDLDTLARLLDERGLKLEAMSARMAGFHVQKQCKAMWNMWSEFVEESSAANSVVPIGEEVTHSDMHGSTFHAPR